MKTRKLVMLAMLTTIALTIFMIEAALPPIIPVPGVKPGLANIVTMIVLVRFSFADAILVLLVRIIMATIFGGQIVYFLYSICGGFLALLVMALVNKLLQNKYIYITGVFGAIAHNMGQIAAAYLVLGLSGIFVYVPYLVISGVVTGLFTGLICHFVLKRHK